MSDREFSKEVFTIAQRLYGCIVLVGECKACGHQPPDALQEQLMDAAEELANAVIETFVEPACRRTEENGDN